jgi:hypothetical protein
MKVLILIAAMAGIFACVDDLILVFHYGRSLPGYHSLRQTMSILGSATSPFTRQISRWWIIQGSLFILFAIGFIFAFADAGKTIRMAGLLIIIYGLGEGIATGSIPIELKHGHLTIQGYIHDMLGGIGVAAVIILPFLMRRYFSAAKQMSLFHFSLIIGICGIFFFGMFTIAKILDTNHGVFAFKGAWQRLSSMNYYVYFITLAILMLETLFKIPAR